MRWFDQFLFSLNLKNARQCTKQTIDLIAHVAIYDDDEADGWLCKNFVYAASRDSLTDDAVIPTCMYRT